MNLYEQQQAYYHSHKLRPLTTPLALTEARSCWKCCFNSSGLRSGTLVEIADRGNLAAGDAGNSGADR
jgi:hypothetical protein